eukprot:4956606-Pyramimonas_sp.AAC.1
MLSGSSTSPPAVTKVDGLPSAPKAFIPCSDRRAGKELYEVPGGSQVDGLPPVPVNQVTAGHL